MGKMDAVTVPRGKHIKYDELQGMIAIFFNHTIYCSSLDQAQCLVQSQHSIKKWMNVDLSASLITFELLRSRKLFF